MNHLLAGPARPFFDVTGVCSQDLVQSAEVCRVDDGKSWPRSRVIDPGPSGYSDLAPDGDGGAYCFYEGGMSSNGERGYITALTFIRLESP
jgi:hypothetical protein